MNTEQRIAYQNAQTTAAMIEAMGMQAENQQRAALGHSMAYTENAFVNLINQYGLGCNSVQAFLTQD